MEGSTPEGLRHTHEAAFCLRGLGWLVVLIALAPVICVVLFFDPGRIWLGSTYLLLVAQWGLAWKLRRVASAPGWQRELRLARRWLAVFVAGCPLSLLLFAWAWAHRRVLPSWPNAATFCAFGVAGLGLYMFYLHITRSVSELGRLLHSPGLTAVAAQTTTHERLVPPFWFCAFVAVRLLQRLGEHVRPAAFFLGGWVVCIVVVALMVAAVVGPPLYWVVGYVLLMRQAAREAAQATPATPRQPQHAPRIPGIDE